MLFFRYLLFPVNPDGSQTFFLSSRPPPHVPGAWLFGTRQHDTSLTNLPKRRSFFKTLIDHEVTVELKNDIQLRGTLKSVDQYLNIKLDDISVVEELKYPHLSSVKNVFIRGSVVRYVHLPAGSVDTQLLEDATRREAAAQQAKAR
ncbi:U6 snRNA-associated Sm-like protein LSm2 [Epichloe bromicola]|uniref:U6 snRNA-associated Sm-like protein LSm2 n=1 Tax=Epichloe bromicola TaxID=79588 RepID=A0ABQ0CHG1_9HYPO